MASSGKAFDRAAMLLGRAQQVYVVTGDGLTEESGVPPMVDDSRPWNGNKPSWLATLHTFMAHPELVWEWYGERRRLIRRTVPNAAHHALAVWEATQGNVNLLTSSVDGLHTEAGHENLSEVCGSIWRNVCIKCGRKRRSRTAAPYGGVPVSPCCQQFERPDVLWPDNDRDARKPLFTSQGPTARENVDVLVIVGARAELAERVFFSGFQWKDLIEIHEGSQLRNRGVFLCGPARSVLPQLLKAAATHRR